VKFDGMYPLLTATIEISLEDLSDVAMTLSPLDLERHIGETLLKKIEEFVPR
jgi:hypothetical protein